MAPRHSAELIQQRYAEGERNFRGCELRSVDFRDADFAGADFSNCTLVACNFTRARLTGAWFDRSDLTGAIFDSAVLEDAYLSWADLSECSFKGATLLGAGLSLSDLRGADLQGVNLNQAELRGCSAEGANFRAASLNDIDASKGDFRNADFTDARLCAATLRFAKFRGATLAGADLSHCDLQRANFQQADLRGAQLGYARLDDCDLSAICASSIATLTDPPAIDIRAVIRSLHDPRLSKFLMRCGWTRLFSTAVVTWASALAPHQRFCLLQSTFVKFKAEDQAIARELFNALRGAGAVAPRCPIGLQSDREVQPYDRVVLVVTETALRCSSTLRYISNVLEREAHAGGRCLLFPVPFDDFLTERWAPPIGHAHIAQTLRSRLSARFRNRSFKQHDTEEQLSRLVEALESVSMEPVPESPTTVTSGPSLEEMRHPVLQCL